MSTTGLTLGKFAPLHKGHQYMIETAIRETDHVIVLVYDAPEVTPVPLSIRANWIRTLYPQVEVIEGKNSPNAMGDTPEIKKLQEDYVLGVLNGRKITHFFSSEFYGDHMSKALGAVNRGVDRARTIIPTSGTAIRENTYKNKEFLSPVVYKDLITNVVFLGAESTGKTTLAKKMAELYNTVWMPEYGKEYWEKHQVNKMLTPQQLVELAEGHVEEEDRKLYEANQYLFTDTNAITTYMFAQHYYENALNRLTDLAKLAESRYDLFFVCDTDIPYEDTWDRLGEVFRKEFHTQIVNDLKARGINFTLLNGSLNKRVEKVKEVLSSFKKYSDTYQSIL